MIVHSLDLGSHVWCAGISSESEVGVEGHVIAHTFVQVRERPPVALSVVELLLVEEIIEVHELLVFVFSSSDSSAVIGIVETQCLKPIKSTESLTKHPRNGADTDISAFLDYLSQLLFSFSTIATNLICESFVEVIHTIITRLEVLIEEIQFFYFYTSRNLTETLRGIGALALGLSP